MKRLDHIPEILTGLRCSRIRGTQSPGVFCVSRTILRSIVCLLQGNSADKDQSAVVAKMFARFPAVLVWVGDWTENPEALRMLDIKGSRNSGATLKLVTEADALMSLVPTLYEGAWGMVFMNAPPEPMPEAPESWAASPDGLLTLMRSLNGAAAISSWYDDTEWLIAIEQ